jgi:hypothetical protein
MDELVAKPDANVIVANAKAAEAWHEPDLNILDEEREPAPELPLDLFGPASGWIVAAAEGAGAPADYVAGSLLGAVGSLLANVRWGSPWDGWNEPPHLFVANVGNPSQGKSPAQAPVLAPLRDLEAEAQPEYEKRSERWREKRAVAEEKEKAWREDLKKAIKNKQPEPARPAECDVGSPPQPARLLVSDTTIERLGELAAQNPRGLLLVRDELAGWLTGMDRYAGGAGGADRAFFLEAYGGRPWIVDRKKEGASNRVERLSIGLVGGIQPDRLTSLILKGDDDGLAARLMYCFPERRRPSRPLHAANGEVISRAIGRLRGLPMGTDDTPIVLSFSDAAAQVIERWMHEVYELEETAGAALMLSWIGKLKGLAG